MDEQALESAAMNGLWNAALRWSGEGCFGGYSWTIINWALQDEMRRQIGRTATGRAKHGTGMEKIPLHEPVGESGATWAEIIEDPNAPMPWEGLEDAERAAEVRRLMAAAPLTDQDDIVLNLNFFGGLKLGEIAATLQLTESRISQIRERALAKLRRTATEMDVAAA